MVSRIRSCYSKDVPGMWKVSAPNGIPLIFDTRETARRFDKIFRAWIELGIHRDRFNDRSYAIVWGSKYLIPSNPKDAAIFLGTL